MVFFFNLILQNFLDNLVLSPSPHSSSTFPPQNSPYDLSRTKQSFSLLNGSKNQEFKTNDRSMPPPIPEKPSSLRRTISSNLGSEPRLLRRDEIDDNHFEFNVFFENIN